MTRKIIACLILISPDAIGLYFFFGWTRSPSTSIISLMIYTALEARENIKKAANDGIKNSK
jgi:hypothetical protein